MKAEIIDKGKNRLLWIDGLRGIAMILVLYGHLVQGKTIYLAFTSPIKIPLFFCVTGYVFKTREGDQKKFFMNLLKGIVIPWLFLSAVYIIISGGFKGTSYLIQSVVDNFAGKSFWYMNCIIVAEILWFYTLKYLRKPLFVAIASGLLSFVGYILVRNSILDFFMINRAFHVQIYLLLGYLFKCCEDSMRSDKKKFYIIALTGIFYFSFCFLSFFFLFPGKWFDVHKVLYYNFPCCAMLVVLGCGFLFMLGKHIGSFGKVLTFIGQNTLVYYIIGGSCTRIVDRLLKKCFSITSFKISNAYIMALIDLIIGCMIAAVIAVLLKRYLPFAVGKRKLQKG